MDLEERKARMAEVIAWNGVQRYLHETIPLFEPRTGGYGRQSSTLPKVMHALKSQNLKGLESYSLPQFQSRGGGSAAEAAQWIRENPDMIVPVGGATEAIYGSPTITEEEFNALSSMRTLVSENQKVHKAIMQSTGNDFGTVQNPENLTNQNLYAFQKAVKDGVYEGITYEQHKELMRKILEEGRAAGKFKTSDAKFQAFLDEHFSGTTAGVHSQNQTQTNPHTVEADMETLANDGRDYFRAAVLRPLGINDKVFRAFDTDSQELLLILPAGHAFLAKGGLDPLLEEMAIITSQSSDTALVDPSAPEGIQELLRNANVRQIPSITSDSSPAKCHIRNWGDDEKIAAEKVNPKNPDAVKIISIPWQPFQEIMRQFKPQELAEKIEQNLNNLLTPQPPDQGLKISREPRALG